MNARYTRKNGSSGERPQSRQPWTRRNILLILVAMALLAAAGIGGCVGSQRMGQGGAGVESSAGESGGEHGAGGEGGEDGGSEEASANLLTLNQTFDEVRLGARLVMAYDAASQTFVGTVENTTNGTLDQVRVEIHLSNGVELGPTTPVDMTPGQVIDVVLHASGQFDGWVPHAEVGSGGESGGEHGAGGSEEASANLLTLDQTFDEVRLGARLIMAYDAASQTFVGTVENTTNGTLDQVRVEIHLSNGVELGPTARVDMAAGQVIDVVLHATGQFDGWVPHAEVGSGGESGGGDEGSEGGGGLEEASAKLLTLDQTFDEVRLGARLIMAYDAASQTFVGTVENTTNGTLDQVRVEIHLSNGVELGPTTRVDMAAGQMIDVVLHATGQFDGWVPHAEVGSGERGGEGSEGGGEHGAGGERGGEHGSGGSG